ncbi:MAG: hypothetical protein KC484_11465 [Colwelliaceae bacterium]|nr:hypothetical protein [Colwelliaceae bacterium]
MSNKKIENHINLFLTINQKSDNTYSYQYLCRLDNGVEVNLQGLVISQPTKITVHLTNLTHAGYKITECLIPCDQKTVTAQIKESDKRQCVTIIDRDNEREPEDYNFVIIAQNRHNHQQIVCDPQIRNKGKDD